MPRSASLPLSPEGTASASLEAICDGLRAAGKDHGVTWAFIVDALRHLPHSEAVVRKALSIDTPGIVGFDLAGPEAGFPPSLHAAALRTAAKGGLRLTIHAGEAAGREGPAYMQEAVDLGAERLGHGVEILHDCVVADGEIVDLGPVASLIHDRRITLEVCPTSNAATGAVPLEEHPLPMLYRAGFAVTFNTDNRLMSRTTMSGEAQVVTSVLGMDDAAVTAMTATARRAAFLAL